MSDLAYSVSDALVLGGVSQPNISKNVGDALLVSEVVARMPVNQFEMTLTLGDTMTLNRSFKSEPSDMLTLSDAIIAEHSIIFVEGNTFVFAAVPRARELRVEART